LSEKCNAKDVFNQEGIYLQFRHLLFDIPNNKNSTMPKLQFSFAPEKHGFCRPIAAYQIGKDECITTDPF
jgi:hypothetical protein